MPLISIAIALSVFFLLIASYFDLRTGEIPDKVSFSFIGVSLLIALTDSIISLNFNLLVNSLILGVAYFAFGYLSFWLGQWGGGDVKILAGIGCSLGYLGSVGFFEDGFLPYYITYFVNLGLVAWPYAILYSLVLGVMKPESFTRFVTLCKNRRTILLVVASFLPSITALVLKPGILGVIYSSLPLFVLFSIYLKAVEEVALQRTIKVSELKEADALADDLIVDGRTIAKGRNIEGITKEQFEEIRNLAREGKIPEEIRIRWGIKFVPILLLAFILLLWFGDMLGVVMNWLV